MKPRLMLSVTSLLALLLTIFHLTDDTLLQVDGSVKYPVPVIVFAVWLYGALKLSDKVSGYIIMLLGGLIAAGMIVVHSRTGVVHKTGGFFFVSTMFTMSALGLFTVVVSGTALWQTFRSRRSEISVS